MKLVRQVRGSFGMLTLALGALGLACASGSTPGVDPPAGTGGSSPSATGGSSGQGGSSNSGGSTGQGSGGASNSGGQPGGSGGSGGSPGTGGTPAGTGGTAPTDAGAGGTGGTTPVVDAGGSDPSNFSFFVVSLKALQTLSGKTEGFGGDLRFGKADGLSGADEICRRAADMGVPGAGAKNWKALLSAAGTGGQPVHARDRIGKGPWYDRAGRLFAKDLTELFSAARPPATPALANDITNERGEPNHFVGAAGYTPGRAVDNHDTLTGSTATGMLSGTAVTNCNDWTSTTAGGRPMIGHSWPRSATSGRHWISDHSVPGCAAGLDRTLGGSGAGGCVGCSGGYGGFFCFVAN